MTRQCPHYLDSTPEKSVNDLVLVPERLVTIELFTRHFIVKKLARHLNCRIIYSIIHGACLA